MSSETKLIPEFESQFLTFLNQRLGESSTLHEAMKYSLLNGGKRVRPLFCLESAQLVSLNQEIAMKCAFALESVHGFSLVHDDLPSMDNDDFRRGQPTTHRKFGEAHALLAGDALLNFANETFLECAVGTNPSSFLKALQYFQKATSEMIQGQSQELDLTNPDLNQLLKIQSLKTGALFKASILCPLLLAGSDPNDSFFQDCYQYADDFGFAFQIADDLEDDEQDRIQGAKNILSLMGRTTAIELAKQKITESNVSRHFSATEFLLAKLG